MRLKRKTHTIIIRVSAPASLTQDQVKREVRDTFRAHADVFATELRVRHVVGDSLLVDAAAKFRHYQAQHEDKYRKLEASVAEMEPGDVLMGAADDHRKRMADTHEKARVNAKLAQEIEAFLGK